MRALAAAAFVPCSSGQLLAKSQKRAFLSPSWCSRGAQELLFKTRSAQPPFLLCQRRIDHDVNDGDTDEMFDELFKKYGKVVYRSGDRKPPAAEADDDADSLSFAVALAKVANEIDAIGSKIRDTAEKQFNKIAAGDTKPNSWTLLDFGDVVVHIFLPQQRAFYNLEEFYGNATPIELPFDTQSPFRN